MHCDPQGGGSLGDQASTQSLQGQSSSSSSPASAEHADVETELAQTYLEHVVPSFSASCTNDEQTWIWQVFVPAQALVSSTIRHGLLTLAAMYIHLQTQEEGKLPLDQNMLEIAISHGSTFVEQSTANLHQLEPHQTNANLAATRLLSVLALAFYRHDRATGDVSWRWVHLLRGVKTVHESLLRSGQTIQPRILRDMIMKSPAVPATEISSPCTPASPAASSRNKEMLLYISRTSSARFATLRFAVSQGWFGRDDTRPGAFSDAIDGLEKITELVCAGQYESLFRILISWIGKLDTTVIHMLTNTHPGVLAIYAHWLMLLVLAEDLWWVGDMGRAGIRDVLRVVGGETNELAPVLSWPKEILDMK
jgi:hypothetical protein